MRNFTSASFIKSPKPPLRVRLQRGLRPLFFLICAAVLLILAVDLCVKVSTKDRILSSSELTGKADADCILVLGCLVRGDGSPCDMLSDRLDVGIDLYRQGSAPKLLMSGDHGRIEYDEVNAMKQYAVERGICSEDVFMDHAGFSTYDSLYRAKEIFGAKRILIVSHGYHLYRALYIAKRLGLEAYGVASNQRDYRGQRARDMREIFARNKDFVWCFLNVKHRYLGEEISLSQSGDVTNDSFTKNFLEKPLDNFVQTKYNKEEIISFKRSF